MENNKTVREHFESVDSEEVRDLLISRMDPDRSALYSRYGSLGDAIILGFTWSDTPEKHNFWLDCVNSGDPELYLQKHINSLENYLNNSMKSVSEAENYAKMARLRSMASLELAQDAQKRNIESMITRLSKESGLSEGLIKDHLKKTGMVSNFMTMHDQFYVPISSRLMFDHTKKVQESHEENLNKMVRQILKSKGYEFEDQYDFISFMRFQVDSYFIVDSGPNRDTKHVYTIKGEDNPFLWMETLMKSEVKGDTLEIVMTYNFYTENPGWE